MASEEILIIGAGLSGISAASKLIEKGYKNITILEAENRIGGRIHSIPFDDKFIDLGGQWVHGEKGNAIYELAKDTFNFGRNEFDELDSTYHLSNGSLADEEKCIKLAELGDEIIMESEDEEDYEESLGKYFLEKFRIQLNKSKYSDIDPTLADLVAESIHKDINSFYASSSWYDISVQVNTQYDEAEGNQYLTWNDKGFKTVFDYITVRC